MHTAIQFTPADEFTRDCFNKWGARPYEAHTMATVNKAPFVTYDLTTLRHDAGHYLAAHGGVIMPHHYTTAEAAERALSGWYYRNREPAARRA